MPSSLANGYASPIEIMDTTLRDGEQTSGVAFRASEKLKLAQVLIEEVRVDRLEIASAHVSEGELKAVKRIVDWAKKNGYQDRIEIFDDCSKWQKVKNSAKVQSSAQNCTLLYDQE